MIAKQWRTETIQERKLTRKALKLFKDLPDSEQEEFLQRLEQNDPLGFAPSGWIVKKKRSWAQGGQVLWLSSPASTFTKCPIRRFRA